jgi:hypothetical protein
MAARNHGITFGLDCGRQLVAGDQLQQLEHRLVVLQLVGEQHLVDEPVPQQRVLDLGTDLHAIQYVECPLADVRQVGAQLLVAEDRQLAADLARILDRVVEATEIAVQRLEAADSLDQPELLEVGDVPEVPGERAEELGVDRVELLLAERLDQHQGALTRGIEPFGDRSPIGCLGSADDAETLPRSRLRPPDRGVNDSTHVPSDSGS